MAITNCRYVNGKYKINSHNRHSNPRKMSIYIEHEQLIQRDINRAINDYLSDKVMNNRGGIEALFFLSLIRLDSEKMHFVFWKIENKNKK